MFGLCTGKSQHFTTDRRYAATRMMAFGHLHGFHGHRDLMDVLMHKA